MHEFIDNKTTEKIETQKDLIVQAFNYSVESYSKGAIKSGPRKIFTMLLNTSKELNFDKEKKKF